MQNGGAKGLECASRPDPEAKTMTMFKPKKAQKAENRLNQAIRYVLRFNEGALEGPILEVGSGLGYFVAAGLERGLDIWGIDARESKIDRFKAMLEAAGKPPAWAKRSFIADGYRMPFASDTFAVICSWYVLEHVENIGAMLREIVRVTRPGGILILRAQDARNFWEGHCKIPWIPFLSGDPARAWAEVFGVDVAMRHDVYDITEPQVVSILEFLNCEVLKRGPTPEVLIDGHWRISNETDVTRLARIVKTQWESGGWRPQPENLYVVASKKNG